MYSTVLDEFRGPTPEGMAQRLLRIRQAYQDSACWGWAAVLRLVGTWETLETIVLPDFFFSGPGRQTNAPPPRPLGDIRANGSDPQRR